MRPLLLKGKSGDDVVRLQRLLNDAGFDTRPDGAFGPATEDSLKRFQLSAGQFPDGVAGPKTQAALLAACPSRNLRAFLATIAHAEGTDRIGDQNGYDVIVGGDTFADYAAHPNKTVWLPRYGIYSSAAGRYQILHAYWLHYQAFLGLPDFSPASQDRYAIWQIHEQGALDTIEAGNIRHAIYQCANIWASLPGAGYGQREVSRQVLQDFYQAQGGTLG